jgi:phosphopantothenoylcysteine decarboxylase/phosphopantothenate--cysteine ligase
MPARPPRRRLRILISSGPTREPIDAVRFLSNYSTGFMGACLAQEALRRGHRVTLVSGPTALRPLRRTTTIHVERATQMQQALRRELPRADVLIMAAAVSDFRPTTTTSKKLARRGRLSLTLEATPDIVASLPRRRRQHGVGFAVEASRIRARAARKLREKRLDLIVGQHLNGTGAPFGRQQVEAQILHASGEARELGHVSKPVLARALLDEIEQLWYGQKRYHSEKETL